MYTIVDNKYDISPKNEYEKMKEKVNKQIRFFGEDGKIKLTKNLLMKKEVIFMIFKLKN